MRRHLLVVIAGLALATTLLPGSAQRVAAASIVVDSLLATVAVDDACTLPEALANAGADSAANPDCSAGAGADTITFSVAGTITLAGRTAIGTAVVIDGGGRVTVAGSTGTAILGVDGGGSLTLRGLTLAGGYGTYGGAVDNSGTLLIERSTIRDNIATMDGGAIDNYATLTVRDSSFIGNTATVHGGAISAYTGSTTSIVRSTFASNWSSLQGGAIFAFNGAVLSIANSTFAGNSAPTGGAIMTFGNATLVVENVTMSGNGASGSIGGLAADAASSVHVRNSIIAGNAGGDTSDPATTLDTGTHNLIGVATAGLLDPAGLADNGGPTQTVRLLATGAAAIDNGDAMTCAGAPVGGTDQRGLARPAGACDIGAVERDLVAPTTSAPAIGFRSGIAFSGKSPKARLVLSGSDGSGIGIVAYELQRRSGSGAWTAVALPAGATTWDTALTSGTPYRFRARAVDRDGNAGVTWAETDAVTVGLTQQGYAGIDYTRTWTTRTLAAYSGGSARSAKAARASARLTFTGRAVSVVLATGPARGKARIYIDGVYKETVDLRSPTAAQYRYQAFAKRWPTVGTHSVRVVVVGTAGRPRVDLDAFAVLR